MDLLDRRDVSMGVGSARNPVDNDSHSARGNIVNGTLILTRENIPDVSKEKQLVSFPSHHKTRFGFIERSKMKAKLFLENPKLAYGLVDAYFHKKTFNKNGRRRQRKKCVRERLSKVLQILFHYSSVSEMVFGFKIEGSEQFHFYNRQKIIDLTGESYKRITEALKILESDGFIQIKERKKKLKDNRFRSDHAIISVMPQLYYAFGVTEEKLAQYRIDAARAEIKKLTPKDYVAARREMKGIRKRLRDVNENPGVERKREVAPLYREYTGGGIDTFQKQSNPQTAKNFLADILQKLKPPS